MRVSLAPLQTPFLEGLPAAFKPSITQAWRNHFRMLGEFGMAANSRKGTAELTWIQFGVLVWINIPAVVGSARNVDLPKIPNGSQHLFGVDGAGNLTAVPLVDGSQTISVPDGVAVWGLYLYQEAKDG